jgi:nucleoside-diphosphate-sugar epimerase
MRILVTGGAGFIGSNLVEQLLIQGHYVRVIDNFSTGKEENLKFEDDLERNLQIYEDTITSFSACLMTTTNIDYVFHLAAIPSVQGSVEDPVGYNQVNVNGTLNILETSKFNKVKRVIFASSSAIYGDQEGIVRKEEMRPNPLSPYALQKYTAETYCTLYSRLYGLETISLRYFNIFGPKQSPDSMYAPVIPAFIKALIMDKRPSIYGDGEQSRDFTYVSNAVSANILAMEKDKTNGEFLNVGCGRNISLNQLFASLKEIFASEINPSYESPRLGEARHTLADISLTQQFLRYKPQISFENGLFKTVAFFQRTVSGVSKENK